MRLARAAALTAAAGLTFVGLGATAASADPKENPFTITCGCTSYAATVHGDGQWAPGHLTLDNTVLHPVAFKDQSFVLRDANGNIVESDFDPTLYTHGGNRAGQGKTECSYDGVFPENGFMVTLHGTVWVQTKA